MQSLTFIAPFLELVSVLLDYDAQQPGYTDAQRAYLRKWARALGFMGWLARELPDFLALASSLI